MKEGLGFLKINENIMYIGNFLNNQLNGFGILYNKIKNNFFFGNFNNGEYDKGIFYNMENSYLYRGKIKNGKKDDKLCTFFDTKNGKLFFGEIIEDEFSKGYVFYVQITEENGNEEQAEIKFDIQKIVYFDGLGAENKKFFYDEYFTEEFHTKLEDLANSIFESDYNLKDQDQNLLIYFNGLNGVKNDGKYYNVDNYDSFKDEQCIENYFINYYYHIVQDLETGQKNLNLQEYEDILDNPETVE